MDEQKSNDCIEKKGKKKFLFITISIILILAIVTVVIMLINHRREELQLQIEKQFDNLETLKSEVYFDTMHLKGISDIEELGKDAIEKKDIQKLKLVQKDVSDLYNKISAEIETYNDNYKLLKTEIETTEKLKSNYFSKDYDITKVDRIKSEAEIALRESNYKKYEEIYKELVSQNDLLNNIIEEGMNSIYSCPTENELGEEFPFAVSQNELPVQWSYKPIVKQTKNHPTWVITHEADVLDEPSYANLFIDDSSAEYFFEIKQVATKEITVQDANRELQKALVNTEVIFKMQEGYSVDQYTALNERPAYLFKDKSGQIYLALENYDGEGFYVLYLPQ